MAQESPENGTNERCFLQIRSSLGNYLAIGSPTFDCAPRHSFCFLPLVDHKGVVVPKLGPRAAWHLSELHKFPVGHIGFFQVQIITHGRRNIETRASV